MSSRVRVLSVTHVHPDEASINPPPPARRADHNVVKLSFFDALYVTMAPIQRLFFYEGPDLPPFPSLVRSLQSSLAATLAVFPPLAGVLTYRPSSGDVVIDCSPAAVSPGVKFVEAEYSDEDGGVDMRRLAGDEEHHTKEFVQLMPEVEVGRLPAPVLAVQVTRPARDGGGAVAVGVSIHHSAADGQSVWQFIKVWAAAARGGSLGLAPPIFDRAVIRHPRAQELTRKFMRKFATALPVGNRILVGHSPAQRSCMPNSQSTSLTWTVARKKARAWSCLVCCDRHGQDPGFLDPELVAGGHRGRRVLHAPFLEERRREAAAGREGAEEAGGEGRAGLAAGEEAGDEAAVRVGVRRHQLLRVHSFLLSGWLSPAV